VPRVSGELRDHRLEDPAFRAAFERQRREIDSVDSIVRIPVSTATVAETKQRIHGRDTMEETTERQARIAGQDFRLRSSDVIRALRTLEPEPIVSHFVVVGNRRFPPKQVISAVTGLDRADFTTHQARRTLMRLGFPAGRRGRESVLRVPGVPVKPAAGALISASGREGSADRLRPHIGQWVAVKDGEVLYAAPSPQRVVGWLTRHGQKADSMFRVPEDELASTGFAPL
jgi:hypothetical protein